MRSSHQQSRLSTLPLTKKTNTPTYHSERVAHLETATYLNTEILWDTRYQQPGGYRVSYCTNYIAFQHKAGDKETRHPQSNEMGWLRAAVEAIQQISERN